MYRYTYVFVYTNYVVSREDGELVAVCAVWIGASVPLIIIIIIIILVYALVHLLSAVFSATGVPLASLKIFFLSAIIWKKKSEAR